MKRKTWIRAISAFISLIMLLTMLPIAAFSADDGAHATISPITITQSDGIPVSGEIKAGKRYQVHVPITSTGTVSIAPNVGFYELRGSDSIILKSGNCGNLTEGSPSTTITFDWEPTLAGTVQLNVQVSALVGAKRVTLDTYTSDDITIVTADPVSPEDCANALTDYYQKNGINLALGPLAMRSLTDSAALGGAAVNVPYYGDSETYYGYGTISNSEAMAALDCMAMGGNPRSYARATAGSGEIVNVDLIQSMLDAQKPNTGEFRPKASASEDKISQIISIIALEAFYGGKPWGNEKEGTKLGREGALEYFFSRIVPASSNPNASATNTFKVDGGLVYFGYKDSPTANVSLRILDEWGFERIYDQLYAISLLARLRDDATVITVGGEQKQIKDIAQSTIDGLLKPITAMYRGDAETLGFSPANAAANVAKVKGFFSSSTNKAAYMMQLIAAGQSSIIDDDMLALLNTSRLSDGTYKVGSMSSSKFSERDTSIVAMALGDYVHNCSILATLKFDSDSVSNEDAVKFAISDISLPKTATENLTLPTAGSFGCAVTWNSSNSNVVDPVTGAVTRPDIGQPGADVILTATVARGNVSKTQTFHMYVPAQPSNDDRAVATDDTQSLMIPLFVTESIALPSTGASGQTSIDWQSSNTDAIANDGTVTRSDKEQKVTLTATVTKGTVTQTRTFKITVGKTYAATDYITDAVYKLRKQYNTKRSLTNSYWDVWAAKSVLGEDFENYDFSVYNVKTHRLSSNWQGTDYGAVVLQIIAQGDNPYNYQGTDYVALLKNYINNQPDTNKWGPWACPIYLTMALDAAGALPPDGVEYPLSQLFGFTKSLGSGPDMAGWAMIPVSTHIDDVKKNEKFTTMLAEFKTALTAALRSVNAADPTFGEIRTNGISAGDGMSYTMSNAAVVMGAMALTSVGQTEFDLRTNSDWQKRSTNMVAGSYVYASPVDALYKQEIKDKTSFNTQISMAFGDLFYGDSVYRRIAVQPEDLTALVAKVEAETQKASAYTADSFAVFSSAFQTALDYIDGNSVKPEFGKAYYTLRDAYNALKPAGSTAVRVLGSSGIMYDTKYVDSTGSVLDVLGKYAAENSISQTAITGEVQEIGGLKGEWRVYNGETRVTDLTANFGEGASLTFKYTPNPLIVPETATLGEHLVHDATAALVIGGAIDAESNVTGNITLPKTGLFGTVITWYSNKLPTIDLDGNVKRNASDDIRVTLTAKTSLNASEGYEKVFNVVVKAANPGSGGTTPQTKTAYISITGPIGGTTVSKIPFTNYPKTKIEIEPGETAYSLLLKTKRNIDKILNSQYGVYVKGIDGLVEFDEGPQSGWMYRITHNGVTGFPGQSAAYEPVRDGDYVEWIYTRDLGKDIGNTWTGGGSPGSGLDVETKSKKIESAPTVKDGKATAVISTDEIKNALDAIAKAKGTSGTAGELIINVTPSGQADTVEARLTASAAKEIVNAGIYLTVNTGVSTVTFDSAVINAAIAGAGGSQDVVLTTKQLKDASLADVEKKAAGNNTVYDFTLTVGGKNITDFGSGKATVLLPYTPKSGEDTAKLYAFYLTIDGKTERMTDSKYNKNRGGIVFTTTHFSKFFVAPLSNMGSWTNPFTDVKENDWFYEAVKYAVQNELFTGTSATTFSPNTDMTRAMLVTVLYRMEGKPAVTIANTFTDVQKDQWYTDAVIWANNNGIVTGYGGGLFGSNDPVTREQMAAILYRYASYKGYDVTAAANLNAYADAANISTWARTVMSWANAKGLITGRTTTTLAPGGTATRAEVASILKRFVEGFVK